LFNRLGSKGYSSNTSHRSYLFDRLGSKGYSSNTSHSSYR